MGALLSLLAFAVPGTDYAQDKLSGARASQPQSISASLTQTPSGGNPAKEGSGKAAEKPVLGTITDVKIAPDDSKLTVTVMTDRLLAPQEFLLENPPRLVLDFPNTENKVAFTQLPVHAAAVKRVRVQQFQSLPAPIARVVLDLEEGYGTHELNTNRETVSLVFNRGKAKPVTAAPAAPAVASPAPSSASKPAVSDLVQPIRASAPVVTKSSPAVEPVAKNTAAPAPALDKAPAKHEVAPAVLKARPAEAPVKASASAAPAPALVAEAPKVAARVESLTPAPAVERRQVETATKAKPGQTSKPAAPAPAEKSAFPKVDLEKAAVVADPKPLVAEVPAPALAAALMPAPAAAPRMLTPASGFSGQPLTLDLIDVPLVDFFRLMSDEGGINIVMDPEIKGRVSIKVVKVPWDQIFEAVLANNSLDKQVEGSMVRIARKATLQDEAKQREALKKANLLAADLETRIKRLNYAKAVALMKALEDQKTVRGTIVVEERTNSLILTDLPSSVNHLLTIIDALDVPQPQVEIEARIVSATRDFARAIGIQFGFVQGNLQRVTVGGPNTFSTIGGYRPSATPKSTYAGGDPTTGRGASEAKSTEAASISTGTDSNDKGNYNVNLPAQKAFGGLGISIGNIFDTFLLDAAITAGETKGLAKLISQPKVTAQNNSPAVVTQGLRFPVQIVANNTVTVQFQNAALTLTVTPQITYEGNIVLDLKVENNTPDFGKQVGGIPSIRTSESTTRVLVSDGGTTVIGGILMDTESTSEDKVPGLGSLPLVGNLFKRSSVERSTQEVLFFVTPRILK
jgi:type IV pilus secretin PilQ/predicted competence protein